LIDDRDLDEKKYNRVLIHWVGNDRLMSQLGTASQFYADWDLLSQLHSEGRLTAKQWLTDNFEHIGRRSTIDLKMFV
jgi:NTE family protein